MDELAIWIVVRRPTPQITWYPTQAPVTEFDLRVLSNPVPTDTTAVPVTTKGR
jgi:hypothetical protein